MKIEDTKYWEQTKIM